ncbi:MAG TPA: hypothetical protein PKW66_28010, partial [Polyangiaceae bacterium]|nr:hypothetical protein [Polyangiaceae bacterium]
MLDCGTCAQGQTCGGAGPNKCGIGVCTPKTCVQLGAACGSLSDGCASVVDCGECEDGKICGGAGIPNQCACVPQVTCASMGAECGSIVDDCGNSLSCGTCGSGLYCGIQTANRCDPEPCTPVSCQMYGFECGIIDDGCGGTLDCGPCASTELCFSNVCCVSHAFQPCTYSCQVLMKTVLGYSQYESVWCSSEDQSLASIANCSEPDPDPCTTYHLEPNCGLIPGYRWCDVTCYRHTQCDGTADCYGNCG